MDRTGRIALPCVLYAMDLTVLNLAVPHLTADLKPERRRSCLDRRYLRLSGRRVPDHHGQSGRQDRPPAPAADRRGAFGVGSVLAAFAPTAELLIAARALLGVAGATLAPPRFR
jgi:DHA2 family multidrug resistance protein-like MFS transporter